MEEDTQPSQLTLLSQAVPILTEYLQCAEARSESRLAQLSTDFLALKAEIRETELRLDGTGRASLRKILGEGTLPADCQPLLRPLSGRVQWRCFD